MSNQQTSIPPGYMADTKGRLIPVSLVSPIDQQRDAIVREIVAKAHALSEALAKFKFEVAGDIQAFIELSGEKYGAKMGGQKGNVTLTTFDGQFKVQRAISETFTFDERLQVAKELVDQCITEWAAGAGDELKALVHDAFQVDQEGKVNRQRILSLRRIDIKDERWQDAMKAIADAMTVMGSKEYMRVYERVGQSNRYEAITLDLAAA